MYSAWNDCHFFSKTWAFGIFCCGPIIFRSFLYASLRAKSSFVYSEGPTIALQLLGVDPNSSSSLCFWEWTSIVEIAKPSWLDSLHGNAFQNEQHCTNMTWLFCREMIGKILHEMLLSQLNKFCIYVYTRSFVKCTGDRILSNFLIFNHILYTSSLPLFQVHLDKYLPLSMRKILYWWAVQWLQSHSSTTIVQSRDDSFWGKGCFTLVYDTHVGLTTLFHLGCL